MSTISDNLKKYRNLKGYSQYKLAELCGIGQVTYARYENGARKPAIDILSRIAEVLEVSIDLITGTQTDDTDEIMELREMLRTRPEYKMLFSVTKNATKEEIMAVAEFFKKIRESE